VVSRGDARLATLLLSRNTPRGPNNSTSRPQKFSPSPQTPFFTAFEEPFRRGSGAAKRSVARTLLYSVTITASHDGSETKHTASYIITGRRL
jgi:hypothetical protein